MQHESFSFLNVLCATDQTPPEESAGLKLLLSLEQKVG